jgi:type I site-specific restriction-modification system R (restriction) subunit
MVDFNSDATIASGPKNIINILIIQRLNDFLEAFEQARKDDLNGINPNLAISQARLQTLVYQIRAMLKRHMRKNYKLIFKNLNNKMSLKQIEEMYILIDDALDRLRITRVDTRKVYDRSLAELDNIQKGL